MPDDWRQLTTSANNKQNSDESVTYCMLTEFCVRVCAHAFWPVWPSNWTCFALNNSVELTTLRLVLCAWLVSDYPLFCWMMIKSVDILPYIAVVIVTLTRAQRGWAANCTSCFSNVFVTCVNLQISRMFLASLRANSCFPNLERPEKQMAILHVQIGGRCNFSFQRDTNIFATVTATFSITTDLDMTIPTSPNVVDYWCKMAVTKPENRKWE